jgi:2-polyprenyl-3-methyl-5-hydroxy-6-metoxy-1,4-benzoquinol methylase
VKSAAELRADFDRIALASDPDALGPHEAALLARLPGGGRALDAGCGTGAVARRLAARYEHVDAVDLSPEMIRIARASSAHSNIDYYLADLRDWLPREPRYDCITSMAVLHHFDARAIVPRLAAALRPGGTLLVVDVTHRPGLFNLPVNAAAWLLQRFRRTSRELRAAFHAHGSGETYLTPRQARALYAELLPGAIVRAHFFWRYSVWWISTPA